MRETKFIEQNQEKWSRYEQMLQDNRRDPEHLNELFVQIMDDLSYARTFYPNRSVRTYLNSMAQRIFHQVYRGKRFPKSRFILFWTDEAPRAIWESRKAMQLSLGIFVLAFVLGVLSSRIDPDFPRMILGDDYVDMTLANIENGDPMRVYKDSRPLGMAMGIAANNLFVALRTALFGVAASIGAVFIMLYNGIMVGAFQYFFIERGLFWESFLTIWIHGTLEISAIIVAGGSGLTIGSGILFPGTHTRLRAFQMSMRRGMKILLGLTPVMIAAAIFEGFFTRYTDTPDALRGLFILLSLAFVVWYFAWLPWHKARYEGFRNDHAAHDLPPDRLERVDFRAIKGAGALISDTFAFAGRHGRLFGAGTIGAGAGFIALSFLLSNGPISTVFAFSEGTFGVFDGIRRFFSAEIGWPIFIAQFLALAALTISAFRALELEMPAGFRARGHLRQVLLAGLLFALPLSLVGQIMQAEPGVLVWLLAILCLPALYLYAAVAYFEGIGRNIGRAARLFFLFESLAIGFLYVNLGLLMLLFLDSGLWDITLHLFSWLAPAEPDRIREFMTAATMIAAAAGCYFIHLLFSVSAALQYFSSLERTEARALREKIEQVGKTPKIRGLAREEQEK
ncbi:MAG: stage II sporulation protein M [Saprospiraceae bacterium]